MTKQSENGSKEIISGEKISTPEIKTPELAPKGVESKATGKQIDGAEANKDNKDNKDNAAVIIEIQKKIEGLFKKGGKEADILSQMSNQDSKVDQATLQAIIKKIAEIFVDIAKTPTPKGSDASKNPIEEISQALAKVFEGNKTPEKRGDGEIDKNMAKKAPEENSKTPKDVKGTEDKRGEKKPEPKQTPTNPLNKGASHVERLQEQRLQAQSQSQGQQGQSQGSKNGGGMSR
jgi:hypothetical protein